MQQFKDLPLEGNKSHATMFECFDRHNIIKTAVLRSLVFRQTKAIDLL